MALHLNNVDVIYTWVLSTTFGSNWRNGFLKVISIHVFMPVGPGLVEIKVGLEKSRM